LSETKTAISVSRLVKSFGRTRALDGLDLSVNTGEVHGFLGPNGSGKTTTLRNIFPRTNNNPYRSHGFAGRNGADRIPSARLRERLVRLRLEV
jgi:ABC-type multidrug transport system ATPase subunit